MSSEFKNHKFAEGEYIDHEVIKKKLTLLSDAGKLQLSDVIDEINDKLKEYKYERFEDFDRTLLPLARYITSGPREMVGFLKGFLMGSKFQSDGIKIKTERTRLSPEDKRVIEDIKMGTYDFGLWET